MHRHSGDYTIEYRDNMKGGTGRVRFEHIWKKNSHDEMKSLCRQFSRMTLEPGTSVGLHSHSGEEEIYYILSGKAETDDNGVKRILLPGDSTLTRNGEGHSITAVGPEKLELIATIISY